MVLIEASLKWLIKNECFMGILVGKKELIDSFCLSKWIQGDRRPKLFSQGIDYFCFIRCNMTIEWLGAYPTFPILFNVLLELFVDARFCNAMGT